MVADDDAGHAGADRLDDAGTLMAEHGGAACLGRAVDRVEVGVADAARAEPHEHLARLWRGELEILHLVRPTGCLEHSGANLHRRLLLRAVP